MLALLLAALAVLTPPAPTGQTVQVAFPDRPPIDVTGPSPMGGNPENPWRHEQTLMSPREDAAAVHFCWDRVKYRGCEVDLVRPGQPVQVLKNSNVERLLWSKDGKYLIGAGANTVRLWNLSGGSRGAVPRPVLFGNQQSSSHIRRLWLRDRDLCVAMDSDVFGPNGGYATGQLITTTRYALPTLKPLTVTTFPASPNSKEAECHPFNPSYQWP